MALKESASIRPHDDVVFRSMAEGGVLLRTSTGAYFSLNDVGATIWEAISDGATTSQDVVTATAQRFPEVSLETLTRDVDDFLSELRDRDLITSA